MNIKNSLRAKNRKKDTRREARERIRDSGDAPRWFAAHSESLLAGYITNRVHSIVHPQAHLCFLQDIPLVAYGCVFLFCAITYQQSTSSCSYLKSIF